MKNLLLQALREEIHASGGSGNHAREAVNDALTRIADRYEQLLDARQKRRIALEEQRAQEERDLLNECFPHFGQS